MQPSSTFTKLNDKLQKENMIPFFMHVPSLQTKFYIPETGQTQRTHVHKIYKCEKLVLVPFKKLKELFGNVRHADSFKYFFPKSDAITPCEHDDILIEHSLLLTNSYVVPSHFNRKGFKIRVCLEDMFSYMQGNIPFKMCGDKNDIYIFQESVGCTRIPLWDKTPHSPNCW